MKAILPDCTNVEFDLRLTPGEEEELLQMIAVKGRKGFKEFMDRYSQSLESGPMADQLQKYRERLEEQASRMLDKKRQQLDGERKEKDEKLFQEIQQFRKTRPHVIPDMDRINLIHLEDILERDELLRLIKDLGQDTLWDRIRAWLYRFYFWLRLKIRRLKRWLKRGRTDTTTGGDPGRGGRKKRTSLAVFGGKMKFNIGVPISELIRRPRIRDKLRSEMERAGRSSQENFDERAEEILEQHMEAAVRRELHEEKELETDAVKDHKEREREMERKREKVQEQDSLHQTDELEQLRKKLQKKIEDPVHKLMERNLKDLGFIHQEGDELLPTSSLLERFAELLFQRQLNALPSAGARKGISENKLGIYEKHKLRTVYEESRMDIVSTLVNSRINHPGDKHIQKEDIIVYREESGMSTHVVIMFDRSSSMEENGRLDAAKRTVMALFRAVKRKREKDRLDIIGFDTRVNLMDLMAVWNAKPRGFTNIGGALRMARMLFEETKADLKVAYLITDGLPEAYTDANGRNVAGEPGISMDHALQEVRKLEAHLTMILLEPEEEDFVEAGKRIVEAGEGKLIVTSPKDLMREVLTDFLG